MSSRNDDTTKGSASPDAVAEYMAALGKKGGTARASAMTRRARSMAARRAARARWAAKKAVDDGTGISVKVGYYTKSVPPRATLELHDKGVTMRVPRAAKKDGPK
jgi:hypothetical protein